MDIDKREARSHRESLGDYVAYYNSSFRAGWYWTLHDATGRIVASGKQITFERAQRAAHQAAGEQN